MSTDLIRIIDSISRDKNIDRDELIADIEAAMASAVRRNYGEEADVHIKLDLLGGRFQATVDGDPIDVQVLGRIAAQTAKQMIIQKTRERERASIYEDFTERRGTIVTGTVVRVEGGNLLVNIGRTEGFLPRSEQIPGETHQPGERIRVLILEVREQPNQVKIILSRSHPEFIERLFELEVPEVAEQIIEVKALAREAGYRTKVAVSSIDSKVDAVGACVGVRGSRIKNIVDELGGEKIDIVRWNESSQILIQNALKPAEVQEIALCFELVKATVVVAEDQLSLAIGKRGQNVRLASRLTGWDIDILTPSEYSRHLENMEQVLKQVEGVDDVLVDKLVVFGCVSVADIDDIGPGPLVKELEVDPDLAERVVEAAGEEVIRQEEEREAQAKARAEAEKAGLVLDEGAAPDALVAGTAAPQEGETSTEEAGTPSDAGEPGSTVSPAEEGQAGAPASAVSPEPPPEGEQTPQPRSAVAPFEPGPSTAAEPSADVSDEAVGSGTGEPAGGEEVPTEEPPAPAGEEPEVSAEERHMPSEGVAPPAETEVSGPEADSASQSAEGAEQR